VTLARSILLFVAAAIAEIGGAWLVWQGVREHRGWAWIGAGVLALGVYGFVPPPRPSDGTNGHGPAASTRPQRTDRWPRPSRVTRPVSATALAARISPTTQPRPAS
jgi:hypothetical protein